MNVRCWHRLAALALACSVPASTALSQDTAEGSPEASEIVPLYVSTNRPLAMLTIGDSAPLPVVFDTGTEDNILDSSYSARAGLKVVGRAPLIDAATGKSTEVPVVSLPDPRLSGVPLSVKTAQLLEYRSRDEAGIFGPNSFGDRFVIVEAGLNRLRIVPRNSGFVPPGPGHAYKDVLPTVGINVDGRSLEAHIDSGNDSVLILGGDLVKTTRLKEPAKVVAIAQSALGETEVLGGTLTGALVVGSYQRQNPDVTFSAKGSGANIGFPVIRNLTIVLDPANKRSWILDPATERPTWSDFTGQFGPRKISLEGSKLTYQREGRPAFDLAYLGGDLFEMRATADRIQFFRKGGRVVRLELITSDGQIVPANRTT
jgi:hypothetical protein